ncbi:DegT/DnrJ/EryC1/StrS family aminotransferase [Aquihabitans daechungensis]|uniref:DegT/DnrJ/EryC1/StrS family aminotransferase n=1 Tax=Aquihabitans daechungensis TaxID=1052257 RepID=UPI003B9FEC8D
MVSPELRRIPVAGPSITEHEVGRVAEAARTAWYEHAGDVTDRFEASFGTYVDRRHAVSLPSCTSALHLSLAALRIGEGDEVIVPDATWIASSAPISYVGATPVFADVDRTTWCIDPASVERCITPRTRAVIAVDLYGGMPDFAALQAVCDDAGIALIEDAAEAIGSSAHGRPAGSFGLMSTFSFHGSKTLTTGEGGMLTLDDDELHRVVLKLRDHGRNPGDVTFLNDEVAFKYKMSSLQAALGQGQLDRIDELVAGKRQIFAWYRERLADHPFVELNAEPAGTVNSYWMSTVVVAPEAGRSGTELAAELSAAGISTRPFFHPLSTIPAYADAPDAARARDANVVSRHLGDHGFNLPSALSLTEDDVDYVCHHLDRLLPRP